ncbi:hypothetical protein HK097_004357, partial [Rhizophlyctis rosea]
KGGESDEAVKENDGGAAESGPSPAGWEMVEVPRGVSPGGRQDEVMAEAEVGKGSEEGVQGQGASGEVVPTHDAGVPAGVPALTTEMANVEIAAPARGEGTEEGKGGEEEVKSMEIERAPGV